MINEFAIAYVIISAIAAGVFIWFTKYTNPRPEQFFIERMQSVRDELRLSNEALQQQVTELESRIGRAELAAGLKRPQRPS